MLVSTRIVGVTTLLLTLVASGGAVQEACPAIGYLSGVGLRVDKALATAMTAEVKVCEDEDCQSKQARLTPSTAPASTTCAGDNCGAELKPTGGKSGFADLDLPDAAVRVTITLFDEAKVAVFDGTIEAAATSPGTKECPSDARQLSLAITTEGITPI